MKLKLGVLLITLLITCQVYGMELNERWKTAYDGIAGLFITYNKIASSPNSNDELRDHLPISCINLVTEIEQSCIQLEDKMVLVCSTLATESNLNKLVADNRSLQFNKASILADITKSMDLIQNNPLEPEYKTFLLTGCETYYRRLQALNFLEIEERVEFLKKQA